MTRGKVVVVGPGEAGKSTLIQVLANRALNLQVSGRTVAMDHGVLERGEARLSVVGVPGQSRFAAVREALTYRARAAIWVHPAGEAPDPETVDLLADLTAAGMPYVVYVNRRAGGIAVDGFTPPAGLPAAAAVVAGNLLADDGSVERLEDATWNCLAHPGGIRH